MYQLLVKTARHMQGHHSFSFPGDEERRRFIRERAAEIWWYFLVEEDGFFGGGGDVSWDNPRTGVAGWRKGGAWDVRPAQQELPDEASPATPARADLEGRW